MLKRVLSWLFKKTKFRVEPDFVIQTVKPFEIKVSIPILSIDNKEFNGLTADFLIKSDRQQISYNQVMDAICFVDEDKDKNIDIWRVENALDTLVSVERSERDKFSTKLTGKTLQCPVELKTASSEIVKTNIEINLLNPS